MDVTHAERQIGHLREQGMFDEADTLQEKVDAEKRVTTLERTVAELQKDNRTLCKAMMDLVNSIDKKAATVRDGVIESMGPIGDHLRGLIEKKITTAVLELEREFGCALSNPARKISDGAQFKALEQKIDTQLSSFERRLSRNAEHVARLQDRISSNA